MSKKAKTNNTDNFLLYIPKKKHDEYVIRNGKTYLIFHHDKPVEKFMRWLVRKPTISDVELDPIGAKVWELIDGENTVYDIGQKLHKLYGKKVEPIYDRLILYIRYLIRKDWISFDRGIQNEEVLNMNLNKKIDELKGELISSTQEILRIKSVKEAAEPSKPFGPGIDDTLKCALDISKRLGFKTVNLDNYIGYAEYGEGDDYVAVLGHIDVVPEGDDWMYPPYAAEIHDGKIYARGSLDDKGPVMAALYGLKAIKDSGTKLSKKVRVIFGTDEETGSGIEMEYYNNHEKQPVSGFTPDAEYPMIYGEKGITLFHLVKDLNFKPSNGISVKYIKGGLRPNMVPDKAQALIEAEDTEAVVNAVSEYAKTSGFDLTAEVKDNTVLVKSAGLAAHGSFPEKGKNAVMQLLAFIGTLDLGACDLKDAVDFLNKSIGFDPYGEAFGVGLEDKPSGKLSFNTGVIDMTEDKIDLHLNLRYPVTYKFEDMMTPFNKRIEGTGFRVENMSHQKPLFFPEDHPLIKALQKVYSEQTGKDAKPLAIGGGTYAKEMKNIVAFGPIFPGKPDLDHQVNEYIEIEDLIENAKIYAHAIYELAK